jgi:hypothetical protein
VSKHPAASIPRQLSTRLRKTSRCDMTTSRSVSHMVAADGVLASFSKSARGPEHFIPQQPSSSTSGTHIFSKDPAILCSVEVALVFRAVCTPAAVSLRCEPEEIALRTLDVHTMLSHVQQRLSISFLSHGCPVAEDQHRHASRSCFQLPNKLASRILNDWTTSANRAGALMCSVFGPGPTSDAAALSLLTYKGVVRVTITSLCTPGNRQPCNRTWTWFAAELACRPFDALNAPRSAKDVSTATGPRTPRPAHIDR